MNDFAKNFNQIYSKNLEQVLLRNSSLNNPHVTIGSQGLLCHGLISGTNFMFYVKVTYNPRIKRFEGFSHTSEGPTTTKISGYDIPKIIIKLSKTWLMFSKNF